MAIKTSNTNTSYMNYYPNDILSSENRYRSIQLIIKNQESISGGVDKLAEYISDSASSLKEAWDALGTNNLNPANSSKQKNIKQRSPKIKGLKTLYGVALPLPNELTDSQSHQWESSEGVVASVAGSITNTEVMGVSINKILGDMANKSGLRKPLINPGYFQDYKGSEPREFTFSWDLIPNNATEVDSIMHILYNLKKYTLPKSTAGGLGLLSPFLFEIKIGNDRINSIINMNNVVCTSININYGAEGSLQFLPDGMPKLIKLDMTFVERTLVTSEFF